MTLSALLPFTGMVCSGVLAIVVAFRARRSVADWAFVGGLALLAFESALTGLSAQATTFGEISRFQQWKLASLALVPGTWILFSLTYARGNAPEFLKRWRFRLAAAFLIPLAIAAVFRDHLLGPPENTPEGLMLRLPLPGFGLHLLLLVSSVVVLMNLERTYRASVGMMRWRIKFMLLGVGLMFVARAYTSTQTLIFLGIDLHLASVDATAGLAGVLLAARALFRSGHFALDVYPSQSVLRGSLTVLLAGIYLLVVGLFARVAAHWGGGTSFAVKAFGVLLALVFLAALLQSDRVKLHLGRFVSRNFQRPFYDYRTVWRKSVEGTASQIDQTELCRSLVRLLVDVFQTLSVGIWLVDDRKETIVLAAATFSPGTESPFPTVKKSAAAEAIAFFQQHADPIDIEDEKHAWALALQKLHPLQFETGGDRVCLPIIAQNEVVGLITLGDRVGGTTFSTQDFDMLKCIGDHAAACLLNVQLSKRLLQAKELEAFQTMAAFFVHDMKNAASSLNLMLQNLPVHFNDPAFREDALRSVAKTVAHMNHLIGRIGSLRNELKIQAVPSDLNAVVNTAVAGLDAGANLTLLKNLGALPAFAFDREQITKVVTNLILNAREALNGPGEIRVSTRREGVWILLSVTDTGCGMTPEFLQRSLFRPFQTTKKGGLGIGMFQSKMIVEAHGGRIAVSSTPGAGTSFEVSLPVR